MESAVSENNMQGKAERTSRSLARTRGRPRKSPSRLSPSMRSPGRRSPARRSPARRSPARRSPARSPSARTRKLTARNVRIAQVAMARADASAKFEAAEPPTRTDEVKAFDITDEAERIPQVTRRSTRILSNLIKTEREQRLVSLTRSVDRAVSLPTDRRAHVYDFIAEKRERGLSMQRDRDLSKILHYEEEALPDSSTTGEKSKKELELLSTPQEWGGWIGALCLIFALPMAMIVPQIACTNGRCNATRLEISREWSSYVSLSAVGLYLGFFLALSMVSLVPIGRLVYGHQNKTGRLQYRINGAFAALLVIATLYLAEYKGYKISDFILDSCLQLSIAGWIIGTLIAVGLYAKAARDSVAALNFYASTNNVIYDFWQGRQVNPRIGPLDVKFVLLRTNVIGTLVLASAIAAKSIHETEFSSMKDLNFTLLTVCSLQIFYCLDSLLYESTLLTSFKILYEGTGYMNVVGNLLQPFFITLAARFVLYQKIQQPVYVLAAAIILFFIGYVIYRRSNSQKHEFRSNPFSPALNHLETISTSRGKRLISSGLWGYVRHPNYLGDILIHWAVASIAFAKDPLSYCTVIACTLSLMHRAIRDGARCRNRYGSAWEQYCLRVKSMIFKRIF